MNTITKTIIGNVGLKVATAIIPPTAKRKKPIKKIVVKILYANLILSNTP